VLYSFHAVDDFSVNIGDDEEDHAAQYSGDKKFIEKVDVIDKWVVLRAGLVMTHPRGGEIGGDIWMTALTLDDQIVAQSNTSLWIIYLGDVMHAVTIGADWFIGGLPGKFFFK